MKLSWNDDQPQLAAARRFLAEINQWPALDGLVVHYPLRPLAPLLGGWRGAAEFERCAACGSTSVVVISVGVLSDPAYGGYHDHEIRCLACGRYTARCFHDDLAT